MVAIFTGIGAGFERGSGATLGARGLLGQGAQGRDGQNVFLNASTGNLLISRQDEFLVGLGPDVAISRTYNSQGNISGAGDDNGDDWRQSTDRRIFDLTGTVNTAGSTIKRVSGDGSVITYSWTGNSYQATDGGGAYDKLTFITNTWTWTDGDSRITETYADAGSGAWRIVSQTDTDGNSLTFTYTSALLTRITTQDGAYVDYTWSGGNLTEIVTHYSDLATTPTSLTLTRTRYSYDGLNRLTHVTIDLTPGDNAVSDSATYTTTYEYVGSTKLISVITETDGSRLEIDYDGGGRATAIRQTVAGGDIRTNLISYYSDHTDVSDGRGRSTALYYDAAGQLTKVISPPSSSGQSEETVAFDYDAAGNVRRVTDAAGAQTHYLYDTRGNVIRTVDAASVITNRLYDQDNNLIRETYQVVAADGGPVDGFALRQTGQFNVGYVGDYTFYLNSDDGSALYVDGALLISNDGLHLTTEVSGTVNLEPGLHTIEIRYFDATTYASLQLQWAGPGFVKQAMRAFLDPTPTLKVSGYNAVSVSSLNDVDFTRAPDSVRYVSSIDQASTHDAFWEGGPSDYFAEKIEGDFTVPVSGGYTWHLYSDDGSQLFIDGELVIDNDGLHGGVSLSGTRTLSAGIHHIEVRYMEAAGGAVLTLSWQGPGLEYQIMSGFTTAPSALRQEHYFGQWADYLDHVHWSEPPLGVEYVDSLNYDNLSGAFWEGGPSDNFAVRDTGYFSVGASGDYTFYLTSDDGSALYIDDVKIINNDYRHGSDEVSASVSLAPGIHSIELRYFEASGGATLKLEWSGWAFSRQVMKSFTNLPPALKTSYYSNISASSLSGIDFDATPDTVDYLYGDTGATTSGAFWGGGASLAATRFVYDAKDHLRYVISPEGRITENSYAANGELLTTAQYSQALYPVGMDMPTATQMDAWRDGLSNAAATTLSQYVYDARGSMKEAISTSGAATADGWSHVYFTYDQAGQLLSRRTPPQIAETFAYDGMGRVISSSDLAGGTTTVTFNDASTQTVVETSSGYLTTSVYNKAGQLISQTGSGASAPTSTASYLYDKDGQVRQSTDAAGRISYILYDAIGRKVADIGQQGEVVEYRYDVSNRLVAAAHYTNTLTAAQLALLANPNDEVEMATIRPPSHIYDIWQWSVYDAVGQVIETIGGDGSATIYDYDSAGHLLKTTGFANRLSASQVAGFMRTAPTAAVTPTTSAGDSIIRTFYDHDGLVVGVLNAEGVLSQAIYDAAGRKIEDVAYTGLTATGLRAAGAFDQLLASVTKDAAKDVHTRSVYDGQGRLRFSIDAINRVTEFVYDAGSTELAIGLVRRTIAYAAPLDALSAWDYASVKIAVAALPSGTDNRIAYSVYNDRGQLAYAVDATGAVTGFAYDVAGRATKSTQFAALIDMSGRPSDPVDWPAWVSGWAASHSSGARVTRNFYNSRGDLLYAIDAEGFVTGSLYGEDGQVTATHRYALPVAANDSWTLATVAGASLGAAAVTEYRYDDLGRLSYTIDPVGTQTHAAYYANGSLAWTTTSSASDVGAVQGVKESRAQYIYDQAGRKIQEIQNASPTQSLSIPATFGQELYSGESITSPNGRFSLTLAHDGELAVYDDSTLIWSNGVHDTAVSDFHLVIQNDGNMVVYPHGPSGSPTGAVWSSGTWGNDGPAFFLLNDEGNFQLCHGEPSDNQGVLWQSTTGLEKSWGYELYSGQRFVSENGRYAMQLTHDGELEVLDGDEVIWSNGVRDDSGVTNFHMVAQSDGNLVISRAGPSGSPGGVIWASAWITGYGLWSGSVFARIENNGNFTFNKGTLSDPQGILWESGSSQPQGYGHDLHSGERLVSNNGLYSARLTQEGELQVWLEDQLLWSNGVKDDTGSPSFAMHAQSDGNLVINRADGTPLWASAWITGYDLYSGSVHFKMGDDGNFSFNKGSDPGDDQGVLWESESKPAGNWSQELVGGERLFSPNGRYSLMVNSGGELEIFDRDQIIWRSGEHDALNDGTNYWVTAQSDGNLVVYRGAPAWGARWASDTNGLGTGATFFTLRDDGNLTLSNGTSPADDLGAIWATNSHGAPAQDWVTTSFAYDGLGNLVSTRDPNGAVTTFAYDRAGRLLTQTDALGGVTEHVYDTFGRGVKTIDAAGAASYSYFDQAGRVALSIDAEGYATRMTYTAFGEIATTTHYAAKATGVGDIGVVPTTPAATGDETTTFSYDKLGRLVQSTDALGGYEQYVLDAFGQRTGVRNKLGGWTYNTYDRRGLLIAEELPVGAYKSDGTLEAAHIVNHFEYDAAGNRTAMIEGYGLTEERMTTYVYDDADRLVSKSGDAVMAATSGTAVAVSTTPTEHYVYDRAGRLIESVDAAGARTLNWYDALGRLTHTLSPKGTLSRNFYDAVGNLIETRTYAQATNLPPDATGRPPGGETAYRTTLFAYDKLGRLTETITPNVEIAAVATDLSVHAQDLVAHYAYDAVGNLVLTTDPNGGKVYAYYDKLGRKTVEIDAAHYRTVWTYDSQGNVLTERRYALAAAAPSSTTTPPTAPATDDADRVTTFAYDLLGRRTEESRLGVEVFNATTLGVSTVTSTILYEYNALGQVSRKTEATGDQTSYDYDLGGRLQQEVRATFKDFNTTSGANVWATPTVDYRYDGLGNLVRTFEHAATNADSRTTTYAYGAGGRLTSMTDPHGFTHTYTYDIVGRVVRESYDRLGDSVVEGSAKTYDLEGRVIEQGMAKLVSGSWTQAGLDVTSTHYNAFGEVVAIEVNGVDAQTSDYDNAGKLWRTTVGDGTWKYFMYDAAGNQTLMVMSAGANLVEKSLGQVLDLWGPDRADIGTDYIAGVVATITRYDARNQAIEVREPQREHAAGARDNLLTSRSYNAFGEVKSETNVAGFTIDYAYNTMGRQTRVQSPTVDVVLADGTTTSARPTDYKYYDASGRIVASKDANGNLTQLKLLAGTGYGGSQALVTDAITDDGAVVHTGYDVHGDARIIVDQIGQTTTQTFDELGRVVQVNTPSGYNGSYSYGIIDYYQYDGLGQRTLHYNNMLGIGNAESTTYDAQGRITQSIAMGGDVTSYAYEWDAETETDGMGVFGGWIKTTTYANSKTTLDITDVFGRSVGATDMSNDITGFTYDLAGRLTRRSGGIGMNYVYLNTGRVGTITTDTYAPTSSQEQAELYFDRYKDVRKGAEKEYLNLHFYNGTGDYDGDSDNDVYDLAFWHYSYYHATEPDLIAPWDLTVTRHTTYGYDKVGNVTDEYFVEDGLVVYTNSHAEFDALGRMTSWAEAGSSVTPAASVDYKYDANGNIRNTVATFHQLDSEGAAVGSTTTQNYWYRYDTLNRVVTAKGMQDGATGLTVRGLQGVDLEYDLAGRRVRTYASFTDYYNQATGGYDPEMVPFTNVRREDYTYDGAGRLFEVFVGQGFFNGVDVADAPTGPGALRGHYGYDLMGRTTFQQDFAADGTTVLYQHEVHYNAKSQMVSEQTNYLTPGVGGDVTISTYAYGEGEDYALGSVVSVSSETLHNTVHQKYSWINYTYNWRQGAEVASLTTNPDTGQSWLKYSVYNYLRYGGQDQLDTVHVTEDYTHMVSYVNDLSGQVVIRNDIEPAPASGQPPKGDPTDINYRMAGRAMGYTSNDGTLETDYAASIGTRFSSASGNNFQFGHASAAADFAQGIAPITSYNQGSSGGSYEVRQGDTLGSIAAGLWGDASLWYKIAEVNGLSGQSTLTIGQRLTLPTGVMRASHSASTFRPYDPTDATGNTSPGGSVSPKPGKQGCGIIGTVILVVIAAVVSYVTAGAASPYFAGLLGGTAAATTASTIVAGGVVAAGSVTGSVLGGLAIGGAIDAAAGSIVSQFAAMAAGVQEKFSWSAVATAGIGSLAGAYFGGGIVGSALGNAATQALTPGPNKFSWASVAAAAIGSQINFGGGGWGTVGNMTARVLNDATAQHLIEGTDFDLALRNALPGVIGQTIGSWVASNVKFSSDSASGAPAASQNVEPATAGGADGQQVVAAGEAQVTAMRAQRAALSPEERAGLDLLDQQRDEDRIGASEPDVVVVYGRSLNDGPTMIGGYGAAPAVAASSAADNIRFLRYRLYNTTVAPADTAHQLVYGAYHGDAKTAIYDLTLGAGALDDDITMAFLNAGSGDPTIAEVAAGVSAYDKANFTNLRAAADANARFFAVVAGAPLLAPAAALGGAEAYGFLQGGSWLTGGLLGYGSFETATAGGSYALGGDFRGLGASGLNYLTGTGGGGFGVGDGFDLATGLFQLGRAGVSALGGLGRPAAPAFIGSADSIVFGAADDLAMAGGCFAAGTLVHTKAGLKPIEQVEAGEFVLAQPEFQGERGWRRVKEVFRRAPQDMVAVEVAAGDRRETIVATLEHPFWVRDKGWTGAKDLVAGQSLELADGGTAQIVHVAPLADKQPVYNFAVDGFHTYYVGGLGVWVHNASAVSQIPHLNANGAVSEFGVYEIKVGGEIFKVGKTDMLRVTQSSGLPTRLHQQLRILGEQYGTEQVRGSVVQPLGLVTTQQAKMAELARLQDIYKRTGIVPPDNFRSFKP